MDIVFASYNRGKYDEMAPLFLQRDLRLVWQEPFGVTEPAETGLSFVENALIKARHTALATGKPVIADDSGLVVPVLGGQPGVRSSRYAGENSTAQKNNALLLQNMAGHEDRFAYFLCSLVFLRGPHDPVPVITQGRWEGKIMTKPSGAYGFGYDPLFWVSTHQCSAAELQAAEKSGISHRGKALRQMFVELDAIMKGSTLCQKLA